MKNATEIEKRIMDVQDDILCLLSTCYVINARIADATVLVYLGSSTIDVTLYAKDENSEYGVASRGWYIRLSDCDVKEIRDAKAELDAFYRERIEMEK